jgi:ABC-type multidrug transport system ATPase subunit
MSAPLVHIDGLSFSIGKCRITDFSLSVNAGEIYCLTGRSGSGKTAILKAIAGEVKSSGIRSVCLSAYAALPRPVRTRLINHPWNQEPGMHSLRVSEFLYLARRKALGRFAFFSEADREAVDRIADDFGLNDRRKDIIGELPESLAALVASAGIMVTGSRLILLDCPDANLDPASARILRKALARYAFSGENSVLVTTRDPNFAALIADTIGILDAGVIAIEGDRDTLNETNITRLFGFESVVSRNTVNGSYVIQPVD